jgi:hypothetical protein
MSRQLCTTAGKTVFKNLTASPSQSQTGADPALHVADKFFSLVRICIYVEKFMVKSTPGHASEGAWRQACLSAHKNSLLCASELQNFLCNI